jgi:hypothetical protein
MTNTQSLSWQVNSVPKSRNYEFMDCSECGRGNVVPKKLHAVAFVCSSCYSK